jgi:hypothetical protein
VINVEQVSKQDSESGKTTQHQQLLMFPTTKSQSIVIRESAFDGKHHLIKQKYGDYLISIVLWRTQTYKQAFL